MTITVLLDPAQMPDQSQDQLDFDNKMSGFMRDLPTLANQINDTEAGMNLLQAGGAYAIRYVFDTATADADPGAGKMRLSSATQNASTTMRLDLTAGGQDYTTLIDTFDSSTSAIKGSIRLVKQGDMSKWMTFDVTARAAPTGYRNLTVVCTDSSSANPFVNGDAVLLFFQRTGDRGEIGNSIVPLASATITSPVAAIDYLNIFSALYDKYTIELQGFQNANGSTSAYTYLQLAFGGTPITAGYSGGITNASQSGAAGIPITIAGSSTFNSTVVVRNMNASGLKSGSSETCDPFSRLYGGSISDARPATGFRIIPGAGTFTAGTIRIYGHRNNP
jgi:hypothetical protein